MGRSGKRIPQHELTSLIRDRLISGEFAPGVRLTEELLAQDYSVSRIPIREALRALDADGFVVARPNIGSFVAEIGPDEAEDLLEIRAALEPIATGRAALRCGDGDIRDLDQIVDRGYAAIAAGDLAELPKMNNEFHLAVAHLSGNASLERMIELLQHKIAWVYSVELPRRAADSWAEHRLIVSALSRGDRDRASEMMRDHINAATAAYRHRVTDTTPSAP
ncbi:GntR family transcriptional regulator [Tsukamurella soli]|uniref:GntR family transcriptional regulator n=1 Tax=Tsukamurella soli TaxID=644556 RepID=A0ABP8JSV8_9ACTN